LITDPVVIVGGARTPGGRFGGGLKDVEASDLAGVAISAALERAGVAAYEGDEVSMGQVGADADNARRCAKAAGIPVAATAINVNRVCGSGLQAIVNGATTLMLGDARIVVVGGDESMSRQPFLGYGRAPVGDSVRVNRWTERFRS